MHSENRLNIGISQSFFHVYTLIINYLQLRVEEWFDFIGVLGAVLRFTLGLLLGVSTLLRGRHSLATFELVRLCFPR